MDLDRIKFARWAANHGVNAKNYPELPHEFTWSQLLNFRNELRAAIKSCSEASAAGRYAASDDDVAAVETAVAIIDQLQQEMNLRDRAGDREPRPSGRRTDPNPVQNKDAEREERLAVVQRVPFEGRRMADLFDQARTAGPEVKANDWFRAAMVGRGPAVSILGAYGSEGIGSDGGFAVPPKYAFGIMDVALEGEIIRPRARVLPVAESNMLVVAGLNMLNRTGGTIAGFVGDWKPEGGTFTPQKPNLRSMVLTMKKLGVFGELTNELVYDSPALYSELQALMGRAIGFYLDEVFMKGSGVGEPTGVLNDAALITVSKESSQAADTLLANNILKMYARMHPSCLSNSIWIVSQTVLPQLMSVSIDKVQGTDGVATFGPMLREVAPGQFTLMGRPVIVTEILPPIGDKGDVVFVDPSQYTIGLRSQMVMQTSNVPKWHEDMTSFRSIVRVDGLGSWNAPYTPLSGSTLSWCVTLEAR